MIAEYAKDWVSDSCAFPWPLFLFSVLSYSDMLVFVIYYYILFGYVLLLFLKARSFVLLEREGIQMAGDLWRN